MANRPILDYGLRLCEAGLSISPPLVFGGSKGQTVEPWKPYQTQRASKVQVGAWGRTYPKNNYAVITGEVSGIVVIEADDSVAEGIVTVRCPFTPVRQKSGSGRGIHHIYRHPGFHVANVQGVTVNGVVQKMDIRGDGGLIVGPGSHKWNKDGTEIIGTYTELEPWTAELIASAPVYDPAWLGIEQKPRKSSSEGAKAVARPDIPYTDKQRLAAHYLKGKKGAVEGQKNEGYAYGLACELLWGFDLTPEEALPVFMVWGQREDQKYQDGTHYPWEEHQLSHKLDDAYGEENLEGRPKGWRLEPTRTHSIREAEEELFKRKSKVVIEDITNTKNPDSLVAEPDVNQAPRRIRGYRYEGLKALPKPSWLIRKMLPSNALIQFYGDTGSYKSFIALDMSLSIASGLSWQGVYPVKPGPVLYLSGEGNASIRYRIDAWLDYYGVPYPDNLVVVPTSFDFKEDLAALKDVVRLDVGSPPVLTWIDTLNKYFGPGDENGTQDMTKFLTAIEKYRAQLGGAVGIVHHTGWATSSRERGNKALRCACDTVISCEREDRQQPYTTIGCEKQKDAQQFNPFKMKANVQYLGTDDEGEDITSLAMSLFNQAGAFIQGYTKGERDYVRLLWLKFSGNTFTQSDARNKLDGSVSKSTVSERFKKYTKDGILKTLGDAYHFTEDVKGYLIGEMVDAK